MSGGYSAIRWLQVGLQTGTTDTPGAFTFIDAQGDLLPAVAQGKVPVDVQRDDGEITAPVLGVKSGSLSFTTLVRGKGSGAGYVSGAGVSAVGGECDKLFDAYFGAAGVHGTGYTVSGTGSDTDTVALADTSGHPVGNGIMVDTGSGSTCYEAREVTALTTNTSVDVDRAFSAAPSGSDTAYASSSWYVDADDSDHTHVYAKVEGENWRRDLLGCGVKLSLNCPAGGLAQFNWELMSNDWEDTAEENPTYSSPTSADGLVVMGSPFYWGATKTELIECSLDFGFEPQPRTATEGANGTNGYIYQYTGAKFSGKIYHSDTTLSNMQGDNTYDVAFQLGDTSASTTPGNCLYVRIPALAVQDASIETYNGVDVISFSGIATRPSAGNGSVRLHLFASA